MPIPTADMLKPVVEIPVWVLHLALEGRIQPTSLAVYGVLLEFADCEGRDRWCSPGIEALCEVTHLSADECFAAIVDLQDCGAVVMNTREGVMHKWVRFIMPMGLESSVVLTK